MPTHTYCRRTSSSEPAKPDPFAFPKTPQEPSLAPCQLGSLNAIKFDRSKSAGAFEQWLVPYGVSLAGHAIMLKEAAKVVVQLSAMPDAGKEAAQVRESFRLRFASDAPQLSLDRVPRFFVCALSTLGKAMYVPPCATQTFSNDDPRVVPRVAFMDVDLLNLAYPYMTGNEKQRKAALKQFDETSTFFDETKSIDALLTHDAVERLIKFVREGWERCVDEYGKEVMNECEPGQEGPPVGARSLRVYYDEVIASACKEGLQILRRARVRGKSRPCSPKP